MGKGLTRRQKEVLGFINDFIGDSGYPPSLREICAYLGISGPKNAGKHLASLEKKGFIRRSANTPRAIEVLKPHPPRPETKDAVSVPVIGRVRAGLPHLAVEDVTGHVILDAAFFGCTGAFILKAEGESMTGAGIEDGDYLLVAPRNCAVDGDIVIAVLGDEATVKRFFRDGDGVVLKPENPAFKPIEVKDGGAGFSVIGKVISVIKKTG